MERILGRNLVNLVDTQFMPGFRIMEQSRQAAGLVRISPTDFQFEYGTGIQFFFPYFIFSPEIKISQGINNVLIFNNNLRQSTVLEQVMSRTFTLSFHFEG